jgi:two-component system sensor histidine kinase and response regulator WspE
MLDLFRSEVETHSAALERGLVSLEQQATHAPVRTEELMRAAHSIKGAARILGLDPAVKLAHAMEDLFVAVQEGTRRLSPEVVDALLRSVDHFKRLGGVAPAEIVAWLEREQGTMAALAGALRSVGPGGVATPALAAAAPPPAAAAASAAATPAAEAAGAAVPPAAEAPLPPTPTRPTAGTDDHILVAAETLTRLVGLSGESMVEARQLQHFATQLDTLRRESAQLRSAIDALGDRGEPVLALRRTLDAYQQALRRQVEGLTAYGSRLEELTTRLYDAAMATRMRPFADTVRGLPRLVRDLARQLGREVELRLVGDGVLVDRDVLGRLEAPLTHLIRNACDHGIEPAAARLAAGKPARGVITLEAAHQGGMLVVTVTDDGSGVRLEELRAAIVARRLATQPLAARMSEAELLQFLFLPGFTTAGKLTDVSGRGVGLDVVHTGVQEIGGAVSVQTRPGAGTCFRLQLPLTREVMRALIAQVAGDLVAFPLAQIAQVMSIERAAVQGARERPHVLIDGVRLDLAPAAQLLELPGPAAAGDRLQVIVVGDGAHRYGLVVDSLEGERELVVRRLDARLGKIPDVKAAAILEDGTPVVILDVEDLVRSLAHVLASGSPARLTLGPAPAPVSRRRILVVEDSITVREVERQLLESAGYSVDVAVDGMDGWNRVRSGGYALVVTDIDMPRMNGFELTHKIKGDPELQRMPVLIVTYKDREADRRRGIDAGADYYLTKSSFADTTLLDAVRELIGGP